MRRMAVNAMEGNSRGVFQDTSQEFARRDGEGQRNISPRFEPSILETRSGSVKHYTVMLGFF
jgi:hypothetical protein